MAKLILIQKGSICYFSNKATDSENENFTDKATGVQVLMSYLEDEVISKCNALELIEALIKLRDFPICGANKKDQLKADIASLIFIGEKREILKRLSLTETLQELPTFVPCKNCTKHGSFIGKTFISADVFSQKQALEILKELLEDEVITQIEKNRLYAQVVKSQLPKISEEEAIKGN